MLWQKLTPSISPSAIFANVSDDLVPQSRLPMRNRLAENRDNDNQDVYLFEMPAQSHLSELSRLSLSRSIVSAWLPTEKLNATE